MGRGHQIDIATPHILEIDHDGCDLIRLHGLSQALDADLVILAEQAFEIAMGEKNGARSPVPHQGLLFPEMGAKLATTAFSPAPQYPFSSLARSTRHCRGHRIQGDKRASACRIFSFSAPVWAALTYLGIKGIMDQYPNHKFINTLIFKEFQA